ncbi:MAG: hypothetical protein E7398_03115 [Ruminococcaceae bacterium]|nr:hypothetical protein [Oscillospiraceae bacterium]
MSRKKLTASLFIDYIINLVLSGLGFIALSWIFDISFGNFLYSIIFSLSLFGLTYSKGALAAKIDLRSKDTPMINALKLSFPLASVILFIIAIYSLVFYNIIPVGDIILGTSVSETGETFSFMVKDAASIAIRIIFLNLTGFMESSLASPLLLLISPLSVVSGAAFGYFFGRKKISLLDVFIKIKDKIINKFNE